MPFARFFDIQPETAITPSNKVIYKVTRDRRHMSLDIEYKVGGVLGTQAQIEAGIDLIRITTNGRLMREATPAEIFKMIQLHGVPFQAGMLPIFFAEPWTVSGDRLAWDTRELNTFNLEIELSAVALPGLVVNNDYDLAQELDGDGNPIGFRNIVQWIRYTVDNLGTGIFRWREIDNIGDFLRLHFFEDGDNDNDIIDLEMRAGDQRPIVLTREQNDFRMKKNDHTDWTPNADTFHLVFNPSQKITDGYPSIAPNGFRINTEFHLNMGTAIVPTAVLETFVAIP